MNRLIAIGLSLLVMENIVFHGQQPAGG